MADHFGNDRKTAGGTERRRDVLPFGRETAGNDQQRHVLGISLRYSGEGVLDSGAMLGCKHAVLSAAADSREPIGHADPNPLLATDDRSNVDRGASVDHGITGITGEKLGSLALEDFGDDFGAIHLDCL